jgi:hypothetical protein
MVLQRLGLTKVSARAGLSLFAPYLQPIGGRHTFVPATGTGNRGRGDSFARTTYEDEKVARRDDRRPAGRNGCGGGRSVASVGAHVDDFRDGGLGAGRPLEQRQGEVPNERPDRRPRPKVRFRSGRVLGLASPSRDGDRCRTVRCRNVHTRRLQLSHLWPGPSRRLGLRRARRRAGAGFECDGSDGLRDLRCAGRGRLPGRRRSGHVSMTRQAPSRAGRRSNASTFSTAARINASRVWRVPLPRCGVRINRQLQQLLRYVRLVREVEACADRLWPPGPPRVDLLPLAKPPPPPPMMTTCWAQPLSAGPGSADG